MRISRRIAAALLAMLVLASMLAACVQEADPPEADQQTSVSDEVTVVDAAPVSHVYESILGLNILPEMFILADDYIDAFYGIPLSSLEDWIFAVADDSLLGDTVIILKVSESGNAEEIAEGFRSVNTKRLAELESYNPIQYERVSNAVICADGDYVYYLVTNDNASVVSTIESGFGL